MDYFHLPQCNEFTLDNVTFAAPGCPGESWTRGTITVRDGRISDAPSRRTIDARGGIVLPAFVDMHTHIDKGHISPRSPNPDGTFLSALNAVKSDREVRWDARDVRRRMDFALRCSYAHGTRCLRTHLDSVPPQHCISWPVFDEIRSDWAGRIDLQAVSIFGIEIVTEEPGFTEIIQTVSRYGGTLGCVTYQCVDLEERLDILFRAAAEHSLDLDLHVDETSDPDANSLRRIAKASLGTEYTGTVVAGHCCSLATQSPDTVAETITLVRKAGIGIVSLPMCNMYLQDRRPGKTPTWRGVTLVKEMDAAGIPVCFASDNTRDPFYAYGDLDMLEVVREAMRICHLDHAGKNWLPAFSQTPAELCGFAANRLLPGDGADFVVFSARDMGELLSRPQMDRVVVRNGQPIDRTLPDYSELDDLME